MGEIGLLDAWAEWFRGNQDLKDATFFGIELLWWGRVGKVLQYVAGLTVILEIIGPDRLLKWGQEVRKNRSPLKRVRQWTSTGMIPFFIVMVLGGYLLLPLTWFVELSWTWVRTAVMLLVQFFSGSWVGMAVGVSLLLPLVGSAIAQAIVNLRFGEKRLTEREWAMQSLLKSRSGRETAQERTRREGREKHDHLSEAISRVQFAGMAVVVMPIALACMFLNLPIFILLGLVWASCQLILRWLDPLISAPISTFLARKQPGTRLRWACFVAIAVGFHFDLLAS